MEKLRLEIKHAIELMQGDICDDAHAELRKHLSELLCMARNELQCVLIEESRVNAGKGIDSNEKPASAIVEPLTMDELNAGGWWCRNRIANKLLLQRKGVEFLKCQDTDGGHVLCEADDYGDVSQIHRRGNEFFWGAPKC